MTKLSLISLLLPLLLFNNCSDVAFSDAPSDGGNQAAEINQPDDSGNVTSDPNDPNNPGGGTTNPTNPSVRILPLVQFIGPPCQRLTLCQAEFRLDKAYGSRVEFDWRTNDTLYQTPHNPIYAQPGVHYNSTSGHIIFEPGETSKKIYIQNINSYTLEVIIGVIMSQCKYGTYNGTCTTFFQ